MNDIDQKRDYVIGLYPNRPTWRAKVLKMKDAQVIAIYLREKTKAQEPPKKLEEPKKESEKDDDIPF